MEKINHIPGHVQCLGFPPAGFVEKDDEGLQVFRKVLQNFTILPDLYESLPHIVFSEQGNSWALSNAFLDAQQVEPPAKQGQFPIEGSVGGILFLANPILSALFLPFRSFKFSSQGSDFILYASSSGEMMAITSP